MEMRNRIDSEELFSNEEYRTAFNYISSYVEKKSHTFYIKTYGCQMNEHDSERIRWIFEKMGYMETNEESKADVILYNTCLIRENAETKVLGKVGSLKSLKRENPDLTIIICGCMMQKEEIRNLIKDKYPQVDIVFGTNKIHTLPLLLYQHLLSGEFSSDILDNENLLVEDIGSVDELNFKSYVNIMYGCNNFCTYCVVPYTRGREISRFPEDILREVNFLAKKGTKEITLLGQNVNSYGDENYRFHNLLKDIDKIKGIERIRFMTSHPKDISDELIECYSSLKHLPHYLHLPVQSGSDRILKEMNRHYTAEKYLSIIEKLKKVAPNIALSTDIIVGFPGETEEDFDLTIELVKKVRYDFSFSFIYSRRPGTKAYSMENQVAEEVKSERLLRLNEVLNNISLEKNEAYIGNEEEVLLESVSKNDEGMLSGRTLSNKLVHCKANRDLIGKFAIVKIENANSFSLRGDILRVVEK